MNRPVKTGKNHSSPPTRETPELLKKVGPILHKGSRHTAVATSCCFCGFKEFHNCFSRLNVGLHPVSAWHLRHIRAKKHQLRLISSSQ
jgi:hypothetical protein